MTRIVLFKLLLPLTLLTHLILLSSTIFTLWPEMVVYPYLLNNGFKLYQEVINPYPPYLTLILAAFTKLFGYDPQAFKWLTIVIILIIDILIYHLSSKIFKNRKLAIINTAFFAVFSVPFGINGLWFDLIQTPPITLSVYFLLFSKHKKRVLISSALLTCAILLKQQALWLTPLYLALLLKQPYFSKKNISILGLFLLPISIAFVATLTIVSLISDTAAFIKWAVVLPIFSASSAPGYILLPTIKQLAVAASLFLFVTTFLLSLSSALKKTIYIAMFLLIFAYPRFDYFHLIPSLAVLSLTAGKVFSKIKIKPFALAAIVLLVPVLTYQIRYYANNSKPQIRFFETEIIEASQEVKNLSAPGDLIYVQNGPDQILALSGRLPPKPWADEFPWYLENTGLEGHIVEALETKRPKYIIFKMYSAGLQFGLGSYRPKDIQNYIDQNYEIKEVLSGDLYLKQINEN